MGAEQELTWTATVVAAYDHSRPAVRFGDLTWSGRELLDRAAGAADWLDTLGLALGAPVPALAATSADALALVVGGAYPVTRSPRSASA